MSMISIELPPWNIHGASKICNYNSECFSFVAFFSWGQGVKYGACFLLYLLLSMNPFDYAQVW